jgi:hypothetical protein
MALSTSDFTEPEGELREDMFPGVGDLEASGGYLETWMSEAQGKSSEETAQKRWVYHRASKQVWLRLTTNPREADLDEEGNLRYSEQQVAAFKEMADERREAFEEIEEETGEPQGPAVRSQSRDTTTSWV